MTNKLTQHVRVHFEKLVNSSDDFNAYMATPNNQYAITGNVMFDRLHAVRMVLEEARKAGDPVTTGAAEGDIYQCMVRLMRDRKHSAATAAAA